MKNLISRLFYNPNITEKEEYEKRIEELKRFTQEAEFMRNVVVCDGAYEPEKFYAIAKGLEKNRSVDAAAISVMNCG